MAEPRRKRRTDPPKDLKVDQPAIPGQDAAQALHREAERRRQNGTPVVLPAVFEAPGPDWRDGYPYQAALVVGLQGCGTFAKAEQAAAAFINPMLDNTAQRAWDPHHGTWA